MTKAVRNFSEERSFCHSIFIRCELFFLPAGRQVLQVSFCGKKKCGNEFESVDIANEFKEISFD